MQPKLTDKRLYWRGTTIWCSVPGPDGYAVRKSTGCKDEQAATAKANAFERSSTDADYAGAATTTLADAVTLYLADLDRRRRSDATKKIARQKVGHFGRLWGPSLPMIKITAARVLEYIDTRQKDGVTDFTIKKELGHLGQVLRIARHVGAFHLDVNRVLPPYFTGAHKPVERWPTPEEVELLAPHLEPYRLAHLLYILATGARLQESIRAERTDVDYVRKVVRMHGSKTAASKGDVPITEITRPILEAALARAPGDKPLFRPWGKLHRDLAAACVRAGIPKLTPNDFRRGLARWHKLAGVNNETVSKMLRHTTDKLVQTVYANLTGEEVGKLVAKQLGTVSNLYGGSDKTGQTGSNQQSETAKKPAPPARIELATNGLGNRCSIH